MAVTPPTCHQYTGFGTASDASWATAKSDAEADWGVRNTGPDVPMAYTSGQYASGTYYAETKRVSTTAWWGHDDFLEMDATVRFLGCAGNPYGITDYEFEDYGDGPSAEDTWYLFDSKAWASPYPDDLTSAAWGDQGSMSDPATESWCDQPSDWDGALTFKGYVVTHDICVFEWDVTNWTPS